ncbi:hypothetical protein [Vreelandella alkaliphila]|uniref:Uncharacterized protein n=1 Tax=Vreelandella alkaliphila TaxID=272774 RepID=A0AAJ2VQJ1_9GAMM|nr:hypothetical protein [Halomonas alkaliphila]MDX5979602.1 hypothetical protein [Halomonas alkaliphila]
MSNLTYLAGCGGVALAAFMLANAFLNGPSQSRASLLLPAAVLLILAWSLGLGPDTHLLIDLIRAASSAWVVHFSTHHLEDGHHA